MPRASSFTLLTLFLRVALCSPAAAAQTPPADAAPPVRLLIDCQNAPCDFDFFRTELNFVDHVRERQDADVHLLITSEGTGQGGREVTLSFFGQGRFAGLDQALRTTFLVAESQDAVRREMVRVIALGLVPYAVRSPALATLSVAARRAGPAAPAPAAPPGEDPWNRWSLRVALQGNLSGERTSRSSLLNTSINANRTTDDLKLNATSYFTYRQSTFELPDGRRFLSPNREYGVNGLVARTVGGQWATGVRAAFFSTTFQNIDAAWYVAPAIEYDIFPYAESTRRLFTLQYSAGVRGYDYDRETILLKERELRAAHVFDAQLTLRQRWGTVGASFEAASFLPQIEQRHVTGFGNLNLNVARGLSFNLNGSISSIRDQIYLPRVEATSEEVLVRQRQLATSYRYQMFFGVSYTFGSIFSSVVNPRLQSGGF